MPFFSIIIPLYNKEFFIQNTLRSVLDQTFIDFEIIIVNDGSTDKSEKKVLQFKDTRISYYSKKNSGVSSARNFGIEKSQSNYIAFIDADDYWYPNHLQEIHNLILQKKHLKVFTSLLEIESEFRVFKAKYSNLKKNKIQEINFFETSLSRIILSSSTAVIDRTITKEIGFFDTKLHKGEDTDYWIRIGFKYKIGLVNKITARHVFIKNRLNEELFSSKILNFEKFIELERENKSAKKMIDINRFSLAIKYKTNKDYKNYNLVKNNINLKNLALKQRLLLQFPSTSLSLLHKFKLFLERKKIKISAF